MMRRRELMGMQGVLKTVSAPIVTVSDAMARNAKSLVVNFAPVQAAGTPAPDNVLPISGRTGVTGYRAGKNLCDIGNPLFTAPNESQFISYNSYINNGVLMNGGVVGAANGTGLTFGAVARCNYTISFMPGGESANYTIVAANIGSNNVWLNYAYVLFQETTVGQRKCITFTFPSGYTHVYFAGFSATKYGSWESNIQLEVGTTPTTYTPYTGTTYPVDWGTQVNKTISGTNGSIFTENGMSTTGYIAVNPGDVFVYTFTSSAAGRSRRIYGYDSSKAPTSSLAGVGWVNVGTTYTLTATIPSGVSYIRISFVTNDTDISIVETNSGAAYVIARQEIGTVYGGYVDLASGVLVVDRLAVVLDGSTNDYVSAYLEGGNSTGDWLNVACTLAGDFATSSAGQELLSKSVCSFVPYKFANADGTPHFYKAGNVNFFVSKADYANVAAFTGWLSNNPQTLIAMLATPVTYQLTPQTIAMLKGTNNVWSNANGNVELTYYAQ